MKAMILSVVAAFVLMQGTRSVGEEPKGKGNPAKKELIIKLRVYEGDPKGSIEAGTIRCVAEPTVVTLEKQSFAIFVGGEVPIVDDAKNIEFVQVGNKLEGRVGPVKDDQVRIDLTFSQTKAGEKNDQRQEFHTDSTRTLATVKLGEMTKLSWGKADGNKQTWGELSIEK